MAPKDDLKDFRLITYHEKVGGGVQDDAPSSGMDEDTTHVSRPVLTLQLLEHRRHLLLYSPC